MDHHHPADYHVQAWRLGLDCSCRRWREAVDLDGTLEEAEAALRALHDRHASLASRPEVRPGPILAPREGPIEGR